MTSLRVVLTSNIHIVIIALASKSKLVIWFLISSVEQKLKSSVSSWSEFISITINYWLTLDYTAFLLVQDCLNYVVNNTKDKIKPSEIRYA
jgi:hypothetical protein